MQKLACAGWGSTTKVLRSSTLALMYSVAEYSCYSIWYTPKIDMQLNVALEHLLEHLVVSAAALDIRVGKYNTNNDSTGTLALLHDYANFYINKNLPIYTETKIANAPN